MKAVYTIATVAVNILAAYLSFDMGEGGLSLFFPFACFIMGLIITLTKNEKTSLRTKDIGFGLLVGSLISALLFVMGLVWMFANYSR